MQIESDAAAADDDIVPRCNFDEFEHLVPLSKFGDKPPLFCIFPLRSDSEEFALGFPEDQPLYGIYLFHQDDGRWQIARGLLDENPTFPSVEQIAGIFLKEIRSVQTHGPYQLCGYSNAGFVAYEIARQLIIEGESVSMLALFETWYPGYKNLLTKRELIQFRALGLLHRLKKYGGNIARISEIGIGIRRRTKRTAWRILRRLIGDRSIPKNMEFVEATIVLESYVPGPYPNRIILIRADGPLERTLKDETLGWRTCVRGGVDVSFVCGGHSVIMHKPHVHDLIEMIKPRLAHGARQ